MNGPDTSHLERLREIQEKSPEAIERNKRERFDRERRKKLHEKAVERRKKQKKNLKKGKKR